MTSASRTRTDLQPLIQGVVYGPVRSRRLGCSLGLNILPPGRKVCTFNCVYCQYGWTRATEAPARDWPTVSAIADALEAALARTGRPPRIDRITLAGHGEPTLHPDFPEVIDAVSALRDRLAPGARVAVLSNGTRAGDPAVRRALALVEEPCLKLDGGTACTIRRTNGAACTVDALIDAYRAIPSAVIQSMFVEDPQRRCGNASDVDRQAWIAAMCRLRPRRVHLYTLARPPALARLRAVSRSWLDRLAAAIRSAGLDADVFV
jgi:wyosine [tRNA(Phe)-imidazoG37] synthetase (radical SAM superfamily)